MGIAGALSERLFAPYADSDHQGLRCNQPRSASPESGIQRHPVADRSVQQFGCASFRQRNRWRADGDGHQGVQQIGRHVRLHHPLHAFVHEGGPGRLAGHCEPRPFSSHSFHHGLPHPDGFREPAYRSRLPSAPQRSGFP